MGIAILFWAISMVIFVPEIILARKIKPSLASRLPMAGIIMLQIGMLFFFIGEHLSGAKNLTGPVGEIIILISPAIGIGSSILQIEFFIRKKIEAKQDLGRTVKTPVD